MVVIKLAAFSDEKPIISAHLLPEPDRTIAKWRWERSQTFERDDWLINEMATVFGKSSEEVDAAWLYASS